MSAPVTPHAITQVRECLGRLHNQQEHLSLEEDYCQDQSRRLDLLVDADEALATAEEKATAALQSITGTEERKGADASGGRPWHQHP